MNRISFISGILMLVVWDAVTKYFTPLFFTQKQEIIPWLLSLQYVQNSGIAFSFPVTGILLKIITCILIFGISWYYITQEKHKKNLLLDLWYILVFAGALGNAWERLFRGYVTDMIALEYFAVFNLADSYICIGGLCILIAYRKYT